MIEIITDDIAELKLRQRQMTLMTLENIRKELEAEAYTKAKAPNPVVETVPKKLKRGSPYGFGHSSVAHPKHEKKRLQREAKEAEWARNKAARNGES